MTQQVGPHWPAIATTPTHRTFTVFRVGLNPMEKKASKRCRKNLNGMVFALPTLWEIKVNCVSGHPRSTYVGTKFIFKTLAGPRPSRILKMAPVDLGWLEITYLGIFIFVELRTYVIT